MLGTGYFLKITNINSQQEKPVCPNHKNQFSQNTKKSPIRKNKLHSDSGTMSIFPPVTEYFGHRNRTPIFKIVARKGLQVFFLEDSRNKFKYPSPLGVGLLTLPVSKMKAVNRKSLRLATDVGGYGLDKHILKRSWWASFVYQATSSQESGEVFRLFLFFF